MVPDSAISEANSVIMFSIPDDGTVDYAILSVCFTSHAGVTEYNHKVCANLVSKEGVSIPIFPSLQVIPEQVVTSSPEIKLVNLLPGDSLRVWTPTGATKGDIYFSVSYMIMEKEA